MSRRYIDPTTGQRGGLVINPTTTDFAIAQEILYQIYLRDRNVPRTKLYGFSESEIASLFRAPAASYETVLFLLNAPGNYGDSALNYCTLEFR